MLNITGNDISSLNDTDLRSLIGLLCEAELSTNGLPTAGVTCGGDQNAPDGGIDVRVEVTDTPHNDSFIPRAKTAFQVKKPDMPRAEIIKEMKPSGILRESIKELADSNGAYIIISSQGSTADSALRNRVQAMFDALCDLPNASNIKVHFYDRDRVAGWVRSHASIVLWIRERLGRSMQGWKPYTNWSNSPDGVESKYFCDKQIRLHHFSVSDSEGMEGLAGIEVLRGLLHNPRSSVRLVGLSGVGKTRLVQALFDERVGENPLNKTQVLYTDMGDSPDPLPKHFAEQLIALKKPAILIIDNCPPELHKNLTSVCTSSESLISLITVEYDVRDDQPEETEVFRLEPASDDLIEAVIRARYSNLTQINARTIAIFSGGNARIAMALASTVKKGENLSKLTDSTLFNRLFHQRNDPDKELLRAAEACALVYSFECVTDEGADIELQRLSLLANMSVIQLYRHISELKRRDLIQERSKWRAVLPHALANRLAQQALENIPIINILSVFERDDSTRLLKSFSRRLSYLHESNIAKEIARKWLSEGGLLCDISNLNTLGIELFKNISPIEPEATLDAIEKTVKSDQSGIFLSRNNQNFREFTRLLRSLAYDKALFTCSVRMLCQFALSEKPKENSDSIRNLLKTLFYAQYSGTHAAAEERLNIIASLIESDNEKQIELAFELLDGSLEAWHFNTHYGFEFGARSRDYGSYPKNHGEVLQWFKLYIDFLVDYAISTLPIANQAKSLLANNFRGLWIKAGVIDILENAVNKIIETGPWTDGWLAVKTTLRFDSNSMNPDSLSRLHALASLLEPMSLIERARLFALRNHHNTLDLIDTFDDENHSSSYAKAMETTRALGREVMNNEPVFNELLPELLSIKGMRLFSFGQGLADTCIHPIQLWTLFKQHLSSIDVERQNFQLLQGFLNSLADQSVNTVNELLDDALTDTVLREVFPSLQSSIPLNDKGIERLEISIKNDFTSIHNYTYLGIYEIVSDESFCRLLRLIISKTEGINVAIPILQMRIQRNLDKELIVSNAVSKLGQELLLNYQFSENNYQNNMDYELGEIIKVCFTDEDAYISAKKVCETFAKGIVNYEIFNINYKRVLEAFAVMQPRAFLDGMFYKNIEKHLTDRMISEDENIFNSIDDDLILKWCDENPINRYPHIAANIKPYKIESGSNKPVWTSLAKKILTNSSNSLDVLNAFKSRFYPSSWGGSLADILQKGLELIVELKNHNDPFISEWATKEEILFNDEIAQRKEWEIESYNARDESFE
jgi:hypothetical protein